MPDDVAEEVDLRWSVEGLVVGVRSAGEAERVGRWKLLSSSVLGREVEMILSRKLVEDVETELGRDELVADELDAELDDAAVGEAMDVDVERSDDFPVEK